MVVTIEVAKSKKGLDPYGTVKLLSDLPEVNIIKGSCETRN